MNNNIKIKYGQNIANQNKNYIKDKTNIDTPFKPLSLVSLQETMFESIPNGLRSFLTITLGGIPIVQQFYNRYNIILNRQINKYINDLESEYMNNYGLDKDQVEEDFNDYIFLCNAQSEQINAEESIKTYTREELIDYYISII
jgi:hypothetical protein